MREIGARAAERGNYDAPQWVATGNDDAVVVPVDTDSDGIDDDGDNCPEVSNPAQEDMDGDGFGDNCDSDIDGDGRANNRDNCPEVANPDQVDVDSDGAGDICDESTTNPGTDGTDTDTGEVTPGGNTDGFVGDPCDDSSGFVNDCRQGTEVASVQASCSTTTGGKVPTPWALLVLAGGLVFWRRQR